ncbi:cysteine proteinase 15A-like [Vicia villosa]|uniref:cysteine proteinase 15A-like n=1 Tax=Vicia villosa TaxID=3911 RepID=UPI00273B891B|nr:cysteine proteinase 15A-like [Vicia villosa]
MILFSLFLLTQVGSLTLPANNFTAVEDHLHHFNRFQLKFVKYYPSKEEHRFRFGVFKSNLMRAKRNQELDPYAVHGVTKYSDLTEAEFRRKLLGTKESFNFSSHARNAAILPANYLPENFDWRDNGAVTPVKDQGYQCGSCWAFGAMGVLEGAHYRTNKKLLILSEQQLLDCDHLCDQEKFRLCDTGCMGGLATNAIEYLLHSGGAMREKDYPYLKRNASCKFDKTKIAASISNFSMISTDESQIAANLVKNGPLLVSINADMLKTYTSGISCPNICDKYGLNHDVLLIGFEKDAWILKNSWGANWGEEGFFRLCRGKNICGMNFWVMSVDAAIKDAGDYNSSDKVVFVASLDFDSVFKKLGSGGFKDGDSVSAGSGGGVTNC